jgi:sirohydrochlorin ferrochelatase
MFRWREKFGYSEECFVRSQETTVVASPHGSSAGAAWQDVHPSCAPVQDYWSGVVRKESHLAAAKLSDRYAHASAQDGWPIVL